MIRKNRILLGLVLLLAFSLIGADGCGQNNQPTGSPFIGGTTGLKIAFMSNLPPESVYDGGTSPFYINVQLNNEGEWEVKKEDVIVRILGIDPSEFGVTSGDLLRQPLDDLMPATKQSDTNEVIAGGMTVVEFPEMNYGGSAVANLPPMNLAAKVCYLYGTNAISQVCIKKNPLDTSDKICTVEGYKDVYTSSAPIQVVNFHQGQVGKAKAGFSFTIQQKGTGKVYERSTKCGLEVTPRENRIWVEVTAPGWESIRCTGLQGGSSGSVTLPSAAGSEASAGLTITCTQDIVTQTDYVKTVNVKLMYDYEEDVLTTLTIKHAQI